MDELRLTRLLDVGRSLVSELDLDALLSRLLEVAREVTGARYAALGILDDSREELERFLTTGIGEPEKEAIGDLPRGRGVLGVLISHPEPLRLADVGEHPQSYGFPVGHPPMHSFLGVPIKVRGEAWGNLYLTEKAGGEFTPEDEDAVVVLADWAAIAIGNARLYRQTRQRHAEAERALRGLETTTELSRAVAGELDLERVLELVVKRARALLQARVAAIALLDAGELEVVAVAGQRVDALRPGTREPVAGSLASGALRSGRLQRFDEIPETIALPRRLQARTAIVAPMAFRGRTVGVLMLIDRAEGAGAFTADEGRLLEAFASSAGTAVATAQSAAEQGLRRSMEASEQERGRWARELHDDTLQELAGLRLLLSGARRSDDPEHVRAALDQALERIGEGIRNLRGLIADLHPSALDELGTQPALEALVRRVREQSALDLALEIDLDYEHGRADARHVADLEAAIYRLVQEALTNVVKHAEARRVEVVVADRDGHVDVLVRDDGRGFDTSRLSEGFGLIGMRERVALAGGTLKVQSRAGEGTTVRARLPARRREPAAGAPAVRAAGV